ncbi:unnamed protein product [Ixodes persulcatus]
MSACLTAMRDRHMLQSPNRKKHIVWDTVIVSHVQETDASRENAQLLFQNALETEKKKKASQQKMNTCSMVSGCLHKRQSADHGTWYASFFKPRFHGQSIGVQFEKECLYRGWITHTLNALQHIFTALTNDTPIQRRWESTYQQIASKLLSVYFRQVLKKNKKTWRQKVQRFHNLLLKANKCCWFTEDDTRKDGKWGDSFV